MQKNGSFVNLPTKYRLLLNNIRLIFTQNDITQINENIIQYSRLITIYNLVDELLQKNDCTYYDIDRMLHEYNKQNDIIDILRKYINLYNRYIANEAIKTKIWDDNLININERIKNDFIEKIDPNLLHGAVLQCIYKYITNWSGFWKIISLTPTGEISNIHIQDVNDLDFIKIYLMIRKKILIKNMEEGNRLKNIYDKLNILAKK